MRAQRSFPTDGGRARLVFTNRDHGDFAGGGDPGRCDREVRALADLPWSWVRQVHGDAVVVVTEPGGGCGREADALVASIPGALLTMRGADCPLVAFVSKQGVVALAPREVVRVAPEAHPPSEGLERCRGRLKKWCS